MTDNKHNGWTNYATWRVNLEIFDGLTLDDLSLDTQDDNPHGADELGEYLKDYAQEMVIGSANEDSLATSYAFAFMADVNWHEIAEHIIEASKD